MSAYHHTNEQRSSTTVFKLIIFLGFLGLGGFLLVGDYLDENSSMGVNFQAIDVAHKTRMGELGGQVQKIYNETNQIKQVKSYNVETGLEETFIGTDSEIKQAIKYNADLKKLQMNNVRELKEKLDENTKKLARKNGELADAVNNAAKAENRIAIQAKAVTDNVKAAADTAKNGNQATYNAVLNSETAVYSKMKSNEKHCKKQMKANSKNIHASLDSLNTDKVETK